MEKLGHRPALDGVRGVAITLVLAAHFLHWNPGGYGVDLFFVLSGFLITTLLVQERELTGRIDFRGFYIRRARRLFPALAVVLTGYLIIDAAKGHDGIHNVIAYGLYAGNIYQAVVPHHGYVGLEHLWSLAQEEQFYLVWPAVLIVLLRSRRPARWLAVLLAAAVACRLGMIFAHGYGDRVYRAPDTHCEGLLLGCLVAFRAVKPSPLRFAGSCAAVVAMLIDGNNVLLPIFELGAAGLVLAAVTDPPVAAILGWRPLAYLGKISYSLYLWHFVLLWAFDFHERVIVFAVSVTAALVSYRFVEQPFRRDLRRSSRSPARDQARFSHWSGRRRLRSS